MNHIVNNLWLGSQHDANELVRNNPEKITAILNVRGPDNYQPPGRDQSAEHFGKAYKWIPAPDSGMISSAHTREALLWLQEQTDKQERILIHCMHGISRSPGFLVAFLVKSGISSSLEEAKARVVARRPVLPAVQLPEPVRHVVLVSALTGLPNRRAFDQAKPSPFVAICDLDTMKAFNDIFGPIAGDMLLRRLGKILVGLGLVAYHSESDEFLCTGESREELNAKLSEARQIFGRPFPLYAEGRIRTIEGADFSFGIGATAGVTLHEQMAELRTAKTGKARNGSPEWLRHHIGTSGFQRTG